MPRARWQVRSRARFFLVEISPDTILTNKTHPVRTSERASKRASEQASKRASEQASKRASKQASKQASKRARARGELPKLIILSVAFRRAIARIDSWTLGPVSHPSNDPSLEILNSPFTEAPLCARALRIFIFIYRLLLTCLGELETLPITRAIKC